MDDESSLLEAKKKALDLLSRREHTRRELFDKLSRRDFEPELIEVVIDSLAAKNLQSDERFAELFVEQRINRGFGEHKIRASLRDRGIDSDLAGKTLSEVDVDWVDIAFAVAVRKIEIEGGSAINQKKLLKCKRFLHSRGFNQGQIEKAVKLALRECEQNA